MIAASPEVGYVHEPLNPDHYRPGICAAGASRYFLHVCDSDSEAWRRALQRTIAFRYDFGAEWRAVRSVRDFLRMIRDAGVFAWHRLNRRRALLKDPIALFSADWVAQTFDADVLVLIRHPAAFVSSLKRLGWSFPFEHLATQPHLLETKLSPFAEEIREFAEGDYDIVDQGALLWRIFAHTIHQYRERQGDWMFVKHENLASAPIAEFRSIYDHFGLPFTAQVKQVVRRHSSSGHAVEVEEGVMHQLQRDSSRVTEVWKERLTEEEVQRILDRVGDKLSLFYSHDWHR